MATRAPDETDILCENCGYTLNGLPDSGKCPECGSEIELSVSHRLRTPPLWEAADRPIWDRFFSTSARIIFRPKQFYRNMTSRGQIKPAIHFARIHLVVSAFILSYAAYLHWMWYQTDIVRFSLPPRWLSVALLPCLWVGIYVAMSLLIRLAARLTAWEAAYRGYRLPHRVVLRALYYHTAHFLPVALAAFITVWGYIQLRWRGYLQLTSATAYLYVLCGLVIVSAIYLFDTYWIGMRNLMYANR
jgi:hypothetical protein